MHTIKTCREEAVCRDDFIVYIGLFALVFTHRLLRRGFQSGICTNFPRGFPGLSVTRPSAAQCPGTHPPACGPGRNRPVHAFG
jgi:hypothetical protein